MIMFKINIYTAVRHLYICKNIQPYITNNIFTIMEMLYICIWHVSILVSLSEFVLSFGGFAIVAGPGLASNITLFRSLQHIHSVSVWQAIRSLQSFFVRNTYMFNACVF